MTTEPQAKVGRIQAEKKHSLSWIAKTLNSHYLRSSRVGQVILDFATVFIANSAAYNLYLFFDLGKQHVDPSLYWSLNILVSFGVIAVFSNLSLYEESVGIAKIEETCKLVRGVIYSAIAVFVVSFFVREQQYSRITALLAVPINLILLYLQRSAVSEIQKLLHLKGVGVKRCLIYGAGDTGISIARRLFENRQLGLLPVGFLDDDPSKLDRWYRASSGPNGSQLKVLGSWKDFERIVNNHFVDELVVAIPSDRTHRSLEQAMLGCEQVGIRYHFVPSAGSHFLPSLRFEDLDGIPLFSPRSEGKYLFYDLTKRAIDVVVSFLLLVLVSPVWGVIAVLIKLDSTGPAVFRHKRVGMNGREFRMYKFRTMLMDTPRYDVTPSSGDDSRITRVGKYLRRSSLDELPQLLNVLRGDMSLVGPRPEMPFIVATYDEHQRQRLNVKPGITGLWQISGDRAFQIHENLEYDLYYIANRSLFLDFAILFQTFFSAIRGIGAW